MLLATTTVDVKADRATVQLPVEKSRISAIRLTAADSGFELSRVVIAYGNGQQHFDDRALSLKKGVPSHAIGERDDELIVETVTVHLKVAGAASASNLEVWGLQSSASQAAAKGAPSVPIKLRGKGEAAAVAAKPESALAKGYSEIGIHYGTTRRREADRVKNQRSLATFTGEEGRALTLGRAVVTIPIEREVGSIPRPEIDLIITRIALRSEDPKRDFTIAAVDVMSKEAFAASLRKQVGETRTFKGQVLVFVHGYNVGFEDAIFRTAQIAHDIGFDGPAITYSWPSRGGTWDYRHDVDTAKGSRDGLNELLTLIARESSIESVNVVAHSMGNDPVLEVLGKHGDIRRAGGTTENFKLREVILAAPDVSRTNFEQLVRKFAGLAKGVTLYASGKDRAMVASRRVASGLARAGDVTREGPVVVPGVETIDVSDANTSFFSTNHSSFADRQHLVEDMRLLFEKAQHPPHTRFPIFKVQGAGERQFWRYLRN